MAQPRNHQKGVYHMNEQKYRRFPSSYPGYQQHLDQLDSMLQRMGDANQFPTQGTIPANGTHGELDLNEKMQRMRDSLDILRNNAAGGGHTIGEIHGAWATLCDDAEELASISKDSAFTDAAARSEEGRKQLRFCSAMQSVAALTDAMDSSAFSWRQDLSSDVDKISSGYQEFQKAGDDLTKVIDPYRWPTKQAFDKEADAVYGEYLDVQEKLRNLEAKKEELNKTPETLEQIDAEKNLEEAQAALKAADDKVKAQEALQAKRLSSLKQDEDAFQKEWGDRLNSAHAVYEKRTEEYFRAVERQEGHEFGVINRNQERISHDEEELRGVENYSGKDPRELAKKQHLNDLRTTGALMDMTDEIRKAFEKNSAGKPISEKEAEDSITIGRGLQNLVISTTDQLEHVDMYKRFAFYKDAIRTLGETNPKFKAYLEEKSAQGTSRIDAAKTPIDLGAICIDYSRERQLEQMTAEEDFAHITTVFKDLRDAQNDKAALESVLAQDKADVEAAKINRDKAEEEFNKLEKSRPEFPKTIYEKGQEELEAAMQAKSACEEQVKKAQKEFDDLSTESQQKHIATDKAIEETKAELSVAEKKWEGYNNIQNRMNKMEEKYNLAYNAAGDVKNNIERLKANETRADGFNYTSIHKQVFDGLEHFYDTKDVGKKSANYKNSTSYTEMINAIEELRDCQNEEKMLSSEELQGKLNNVKAKADAYLAAKHGQIRLFGGSNQRQVRLAYAEELSKFADTMSKQLQNNMEYMDTMGKNAENLHKSLFGEETTHGGQAEEWDEKRIDSESLIYGNKASHLYDTMIVPRAKQKWDERMEKDLAVGRTKENELDPKNFQPSEIEVKKKVPTVNPIKK